MQNEYCQSCRQPLEEWEAGFCEGCGAMAIKWHRPYDDVAQSEEYECIKSARRWTLKARRTGAILATHNYLHECYDDAERREEARAEWRAAKSADVK